MTNARWRTVLFVTALAFGFCRLPFSSGAAVAEARGKPNFVFILLDDFGWTDLACYGSKFYQTPNVNRLASQGMKFTQAYAACHVCSPTRASILTGKYPARLHLTDFLPGRPDKPDQKLARPQFNQRLPLEEVTLAEALKPAGYISGAFGKWHLGAKGFLPADQGFDVFDAGDQRGRSPGSNDDEKGEFGLTESALKFIGQNKDKPFFLYLPYWSVHIPLNARRELVEEYARRAQPGARHTNAIYAAMIESVDAQIGRVLAKLDELKLATNTVVFFTSDNGGLSVREATNTPATSNAPLRAGKGYLYEGGLRVPLIVRWPGVAKPGSTCSNVVLSTDYFTTILEMAGVKTPTGYPGDGESLLPLLSGSHVAQRKPVFWHYPHYDNQGGTPGGAVREGDFKLIEFYEDNHLELYNLSDDLGERVNLAGKNPGKANELARKLADWRQSVDAQMMHPNPDYDPGLPRQTPHEQ